MPKIIKPVARYKIPVQKAEVSSATVKKKEGSPLPRPKVTFFEPERQSPASMASNKVKKDQVEQEDLH